MIKLENVSRTYSMGDTEVVALDDVSLSVEAGEVLAIVGPSGSGKSTLLNILSCLDAPSSGTYLFKGEPVDTLTDRQRSALRNKEFGFVFQAYNLLPRASALENVSLPLMYGNTPRGQRRPRSEECLRAVGLDERMHHRPSELSGGEQQRVAIARALVNKPSVILADEPTGNLDSRSGAEIVDLLLQLNEEGITLIMVTHTTDVADKARRVIAIRDGRIGEPAATSVESASPDSSPSPP